MAQHPLHMPAGNIHASCVVRIMKMEWAYNLAIVQLLTSDQQTVLDALGKRLLTTLVDLTELVEQGQACTSGLLH